MAGVTIGWDESDPANTKNLGLGAGDIRSLKTNLSGGLGAEHVWPTSGGAAGAHAKGSAVVHYGAASAVSSSDTEGRLMLTSDTSRLYHVGSAVTQFLGSRFGIEAAPLNQTVASKISQIWAMECGVGSMVGGSATTTVTFQTTFVTPGAVVVATPKMTNPAGNSPPGGVIVEAGVNTANFVLNSINSAGEATAPDSAYSFNWIAMGFKAG